VKDVRQFLQRHLRGCITPVGTLSTSMRVYFSRYHIWAAAYFARASGDIEKDRESGFHLDHRAFVTGAIIESVSFLEAAINELFTDAAENRHTPAWTGALSAGVLKQLGSMWEFVSNKPILDKYQTALVLAGKKAYDRGAAPYQDVALLIQLRNRLVHFRPESLTAGVPSDPTEIHPVGKRLQRKFPPNRLMEHAGNPYFPDKCLGHGAATWAVGSSLKFADDFFLSRMGVTPNYYHIRADLSTT
jgi:hypothetical protein